MRGYARASNAILSFAGNSSAKELLPRWKADYINATVGFTKIGEATHIPAKSLMRMPGPTGNPSARR